MKNVLVRAALLSSAVVAMNPAFANHSWGSYHWARTTNPLNLTVNVAVGSDWSQSVNTAIGDWNQSNVLTLIGVPKSGVSTRKCDPISGQILVCSDSYGLRGWLGVASIWASGSHITQATTKLNDSYYSPSYAGGFYNTGPWRALVACQEIGHDFGLDHQDENFDNPNLGTCMDYTNDADGGGTYGPSNEHPNQHDYDQLATIYSHSDGGGGGSGGGGTCNPKSPKCNNGAGDAFTFREVGQPHPAQGTAAVGNWGRTVSYDKAGRPDTFELDLGGGNRRLTHVFWVPGFKPLPEQMHD